MYCDKCGKTWESTAHVCATPTNLSWNETARQPKVVIGLNGCGFDKCPKCGGGLATFRHPGAKVHCANCGLVLQEEGGRKVYQPAPSAEMPIPTVEEIADHIDVWFRTGEDRPWSFIVEDLAGSIHSMLTKGRGGV